MDLYSDFSLKSSKCVTHNIYIKNIKALLKTPKTIQVNNKSMQYEKSEKNKDENTDANGSKRADME
jgi:hypothetical protein